ncbi:Do family serine endopeptidase [Campylobacter sp. 19-13652]|uniref:Do family serine endopeptidase n=1 Tax=Campylobacter sp. 19-13652 TaxID=2840180 RepID=UPI001C7772E4|nr:Do family serine endopeptidase [Campylobacter sp. 19-13652]BCX79553.1 serine endoprotease DegQ [Campylobacter sp. 19-13652]
MKKAYLLSCILAASLMAGEIKFIDAPSDFNRIDASKSDAVLSYHNSIKDAKASVVNISTTKTMLGSSGIEGLFPDPFLRDFFNQFLPNLDQNKKQKLHSLGSGVIISNDGYIITNNHVIDGAEEINVTLANDGMEYQAKLIGTDEKTDIAVIKIDAKDLPSIKMADSSKLLEGDVVFAIGNPFGVGESVTQGIISALNKDNIGLNQYENFIQTDASINPGNSGGALVDTRGALVGINTAILSRSGGNNGIGFAIPSNMVKQIATQLITTGKIERGYIGVGISNLNRKQKEIYQNKDGALINSVEAGSPADQAGIKRGDLIIKIDQTPIKNVTDLKNTIAAKPAGSNIKVEFERAGKVSSTTIKIISMDKAQGAISAKSFYGLKVKELSKELRYQLRIDKSVNGVLVSNVAPNSKAEAAGFEPGDIIVQIAESTISNVAEFEKAMSEISGKKAIIWVRRKNGATEGLVLK